MKIKKLLHSDRSFALLLAIVLSVGNILLLAPPASAATLNMASIRLDRMAAGQYTTFRLLVKPTTASQTTISISMNGADTTTWTGTSGTVGAAASLADSTTQCVTDGYSAIGGTHNFSTSTANTINITGITGMTSTSTVYCADFTYAQSLKTPSAGTYHPVVTVGSDSTTVALYIVSNDQIVVTAVVPPTFSMSFGGNTDTFASNLSGSATSTSGVSITVGTNAKNGWIAWAKDANSGLLSATASKTIASGTAGSAVTLGSNTEGYGVGAAVTAQGTGGGTSSVTAAYSGSNGGGVDGTLRQIVSSTGTANGAIFQVKEYAEVSPTTPAANDYTDTITVVGAGSF